MKSLVSGSFLWNNPSKVAVIVTFLVVLELIKRPDLLRLSRNARRMIYS